MPCALSDFMGDFCLSEIDNTWWGITLEFLIFFYAFGGLAIAADHLCNAMETLCDHLKLREDVGGATFMALGGAIPEICINTIVSIKQATGSGGGGDAKQVNLGIGAILGSGLIAFCVIPPCCIFASDGPLVLKRRPFLRDYFAYIMCLVGLYTALEIGSVSILCALMIIAVYVGYLLTILFARNFRGNIRRLAGRPPLLERTMSNFRERALQQSQTQERLSALQAISEDVLCEEMATGTSSATFPGRPSPVMKTVNANAGANQGGIMNTIKSNVQASMGTGKPGDDPNASELSESTRASSAANSSMLSISSKLSEDEGRVIESLDMAAEVLKQQILAKSNSQVSPPCSNTSRTSSSTPSNSKNQNPSSSAIGFGSGHPFSSAHSTSGSIKSGTGSVSSSVGPSPAAISLALDSIAESSPNIPTIAAGSGQTKPLSQSHSLESLEGEDGERGVRARCTLDRLGDRVTSSVSSEEEDPMFCEKVASIIWKPVIAISDVICPDCRIFQPRENWWPVTFLVALTLISIWSAVVTNVVSRWVTKIGGGDATLGFLGVVLVAVGAEIPDCIQSVQAARRGLGSMALSSCLGAQTLNITIGLGLPWLCVALAGKPVAFGDSSFIKLCIFCCAFASSVVFGLGGILALIYKRDKIQLFSPQAVVYIIVYVGTCTVLGFLTFSGFFDTPKTLHGFVQFFSLAMRGCDHTNPLVSSTPTALHIDMLPISE